MIAAYTFVALVGVACAFQLALACGMPWGELAMGGKYPGRFPPFMRALAVVQLGILMVLGCIVLVRAGALLPQWRTQSNTLIWVVVGISVLSTVANIATPSKWERILWAPLAIGLLVSSVIVALT